MDSAACECSTLGDFAVVGMGDSEGKDERIFASINRVVDHGGDQWWLYASKCAACGQDWMIAQEERIHDNFYLRRLSNEQMREILDRSLWPPEFLRFEDVIRLGPESGQTAHFFDTSDLTDTVKELIEARNDISAQEVAYLSCLPVRRATKLMNRANKMTWAQLRPYA